MRLVATIVCAVACLALVAAEKSHHRARFVAKPIAALAWLWPHLGSMRVPVIAYVGAIVAMVGGALATDNLLLELGAVAFFASDLSVARDKFVDRA